MEIVNVEMYAIIAIQAPKFTIPIYGYCKKFAITSFT